MSSKSQRNAKTPPELVVEPDSLFGGMGILCVMVWPHEPARWRDVSATWGSAIMGMAHAEVPRMAPGMVDAVLEQAARQQGLPSAAAFPPATRQLLLDTLTQHGGAIVREAAEHTLFTPAGGHVRVAYAPGTRTLEDEMARAMRGGASAAGYMLVVIAQLALFHPDMSASLNRAVAVAETAKRWMPGNVWPTDANLKRAWKEWRAVAPLWAAYMVTTGDIANAAQASGETLTPELAIARFNLPSTRSRMIAWARWFRMFAITHQAAGGQAPLLPEREALVIRPAEPIEMPPLGALNGWDLAAARSYSARQGAL